MTRYLVEEVDKLKKDLEQAHFDNKTLEDKYELLAKQYESLLKQYNEVLNLAKQNADANANEYVIQDLEKENENLKRILEDNGIFKVWSLSKIITVACPWYSNTRKIRLQSYLQTVRGENMRELISIIDNYTIQVKGIQYTREDSNLIYILRCLIKDYDNLKTEYDRLSERYQKVLNVTRLEDFAYVMTSFDLAERIDIKRQSLLQIICRAEFDKYRTYVTKPRYRQALIVTKQSLLLLYKFLKGKKIGFSEEKLDNLLKEIMYGNSCERTVTTEI